MKKLSYLIVLVLILGLALTGCTLLSNVGQVPSTEQSGITYLTKGGSGPFPLYAGQNWLVGEVLVWNDGEQLCVKYQLDPDIFAEGWGITETHLAVVTSLDDIPQTKKGNPIPGQFLYGDDNLGGVEFYQECVSFGELGVECGDDLFIAAHAVIEKTECELLMEAPYGAYTVTEYTQGLRKDGSAVRIGRSYPNAVLTWDTNKLETDFFSLGFGGEIIVEFDCCIANREGPDVLVVEDTWGTYSLETAGVYASVNGIDWILLGEANNLTRDTTNTWQTVSEFDLGEVECAKYIKIVDTTDPGPMPANGDGYDLNTIQALQDCVQCTTYDETAWGGEERFNDKNWATYFTYTVQCVCPCILEKSQNIEVLDTPPTNVQVGSLENDDYVRVWKEFERPLPVDLHYDLDEFRSARINGPNLNPLVISEGTYVCIYYVHLDNDGPSSTVQHTGQITFGADIMGLIISGGDIGTFAGKNLMFDADSSVGNTTTTYPTMIRPDYLRGFDVNYGSNLDDAVFSGPTVDFTMWVVNAHDSFRVILPMVP